MHSAATFAACLAAPVDAEVFQHGAYAWRTLYDRSFYSPKRRGVPEVSLFRSLQVGKMCEPPLCRLCPPLPGSGWCGTPPLSVSLGAPAAAGGEEEDEALELAAAVRARFLGMVRRSI